MEVLVVMLILGILAAIGVPQYQRALESSRVSEAVTMIGNIASAEKMYLLQTGQFTSNFSDLVLQIPVTPPDNAKTSDYSYGTGKAFDYDISGCEYGQCVISALRGQGAEHPYEIRLTGLDASGASGVRSCHASGEDGVKICQLVCGVDEMPSGSCLLD